ncbi:MAG: hypothetical protein FWH53_12015, partial [Leptospirales bacterium]|nr:hypothetical protein [Leptospirales bacterium]
MNIIKKLSLLLVFILIVSSTYSANTKSVNLKIFPSEYSIEIDGKEVKLQKANNYIKKITLTEGDHQFLIKSDGYIDKNMTVKIDKSVSELEIKLEKKDSMLQQVTVIQTGLHPKSVEFTPDGKFMVSALLEGTGVDLFSTETFQHIKRIEFPEQYAKKRNFVEIVFIPNKKEMWVSQMAANALHVVDMKDFTYKTTIPTLGVWTKIIAFSNDYKLAFASNWESHDVSIIDVD